MTYTAQDKSVIETVHLRCDNCGEGFQWPTSEDHPEFCPICGNREIGKADR